MEACHMWLYDLDVENLSESECQKVCNLYQLAVDRGCVVGEAPAEAPAENLPQAEPVPEVKPEPKQQKSKLPMAAYTVVYSAMRDGEVKTGEAYSNAISTRAAKADVLAKLDRAGYQNVTILAIEAGDPDCSGCSDVELPPEEEPEEAAIDLAGVEEADCREPLSHAFDPLGYRVSTANSCGQDEVRMLINEEDVKNEIRKAFDEASAEIREEAADLNFAARFLQLHQKELDQLSEMLAKTDKKAQSNLALICSSLSNGKIQLIESTGAKMLVCGLLKLLLTVFKIMALGIGFTGKTVEYVAKLLAAGADRCNGALGEAEEDEQLNEADGDEEEDKSEEDGGDDGEEEASKEEDAVEPDEKLSSDDDGDEPSDEEAGDEELSDQEKSQLKDSYKKAFKAAMVKCKFLGKNFD